MRKAEQFAATWDQIDLEHGFIYLSMTKNGTDRFATALDQAEIKDVTWHTLRHTFASRLVMGGVDLKTVQELMGHRTIAMTARYAHLVPTHKLQALETLVRPGSVSVQSGYKLATNAKKATKTSKLSSLQFIESK
jgi:site-specific recombinase XerD